MSRTDALGSRLRDAVRLDEDARARGWGCALAALGLAFALLAVPMARPAWFLYDVWMTNAGFGHGILIVPIMLYLLWLWRRDLLRMSPSPSIFGLLAVAGTMLLWLAGRLLGIVMVEMLTLVAALFALTWAVLGGRIAWRVAPIIAYLVCAVPIWVYLTPMLQQHTAIASTAMVRALGVPVYLEGLYISIPSGRFVVAEVCSGMRYLLAGLSLGGFYALMNLRLLRWQICLVLASFVLGIVFNWVRVAAIVLAGHYSEMQSPIVTSHVGFGWVLFLAVILLILVLGRLLEHLEAHRTTDSDLGRGDATTARGRYAFAASVLVVGLLGIAPWAWSVAWLRPPDHVIALDLPAVSTQGWRREPEADGLWQPDFGPRDATAFGSYRREADAPPVDVFVAYYAIQRQDAEAINDTNKNFARDTWRRYALRPVPDRVELMPGVVAEEYLIQLTEGPTQRVVWRTNWINERFVTSAIEAKAEQLWALFNGNRAAAALVFSTRIVGDEEQARVRLRDFAAANLQPMLDHLRTLPADPASGTR